MMPYRLISPVFVALLLARQAFCVPPVVTEHTGPQQLTSGLSARTAAADPDWLTDADEAGRPIAYAAVPLPPAGAGALCCVALIVVLRFSRHRRWVTLR